MLTKKVFWIVIPILLLLCAAAFAVFYLKDNVRARLFLWGVDIELTRYSLVSFSKSETKVSKVESLEAFNGGVRVFIEKTQIDGKNKYIADKKFTLDSLFLPTTSPYPEVITNIVECPQEFKPKIQSVENATIYTLFAGERFNYGVCSQDLVKYYSEYGIFNCKKKGVFEVRVFSEFEGEIEPIAKSFKC